MRMIGEHERLKYKQIVTGKIPPSMDFMIYSNCILPTI